MTPKIIYSFVPLKASNVHALKVLMSYLESKKIIVNWTSRKSGLRKTLMRMALPLALMVSLDLTQLPAPLSIVSVMIDNAKMLKFQVKCFLALKVQNT
jgi:hypothetical protein